MAGFKRSVVIDRPIEEVFDFATDLDNTSKFFPGVTKIELRARACGRQPLRETAY